MTKTAVRNTAHDAGVGALLGLLLASGLLTTSLDLREGIIDSQAPLAAMVAVVCVVVTQCAIAAGLGGLAVRRITQG